VAAACGAHACNSNADNGCTRLTIRRPFGRRYVIYMTCVQVADKILLKGWASICRRHVMPARRSIVPRVVGRKRLLCFPMQRNHHVEAFNVHILHYIVHVRTE
jgi:hypothetical protein